MPESKVILAVDGRELAPMTVAEVGELLRRQPELRETAHVWDDRGQTWTPLAEVVPEGDADNSVERATEESPGWWKSDVADLVRVAARQMTRTASSPVWLLVVGALVIAAVCTVLGVLVAPHRPDPGLPEEIQSLRETRRKLESELDAWRADPAANYKILADSLAAARTTSDYDRVREQAIQFRAAFPESNLVDEVEALLAKVQAGKKIAEEAEARAAAKERERKSGTYTTFQELYEMANMGMEVGKRYRVRVCIRQEGSHAVIAKGQRLSLCSDPTLFPRLDFDTPEMHREFLRLGDSSQMKTITVSMSPGGKLVIHRME